MATVRDLRQILEASVKDIGENFDAETCQITVSNPLDRNTSSICEYRSRNNTNDSSIPNVNLPLTSHGRTFGCLSLSRRQFIGKDEVSAIAAILGELSGAIRRAQINEILQRDTFRETFLVEIGNVMAYSMGIGDALFMVVNILGKALDASRCLFICTDDSQAGWKCYEFWQQNKVQSCQDYRWPTSDSPVVAQTLFSLVPLKFFAGQQNSYVSPMQEELQFIGVKSLLSVPLRSAESTHGCVILQQCDYRREWRRNEIDMVQKVADKVAESLFKLPAEKRGQEPIMQLHQRIVAVPAAENAIAKIENVRKALKGALGHEAIPQASKTQGQQPTAPAVTSLRQPASGSAADPTISGVRSQRPDAQSQLKEPTPTLAARDSTISGGSEEGFLADSHQSQQAVAPSSPIVDPKVAPLPTSTDTESKANESATTAPQASVASAAEPLSDLDAIPTPLSGAARAGLGNKLGRAQMRTQANPLSKWQKPEEKPQEFVSGPPMEIDEEAAKAKLTEMMSSPHEISDYIFATAGLDTRTLGRIDGWIHEIESKDAFLHGHAKQTAQYAQAIAEFAGLSQEQIATIRQAALVHELGKLGSPATLLQKAEADLADEELLAIMGHPIQAAQLIESFPDLAKLAPIILASHEEFNGDGYPGGLTGDQIPVEARIISVACNYHTMVSPLSYRQEPLPPAVAQQKLTEDAGRRYDPAFVQALIEAINAAKIPATL